jgi:Domain of unknown function (DUF4157)
LPPSRTPIALQRCGCGGTCTSCSTQPRNANSAPPDGHVAGVVQSAGRPIAPSVRAFFEDRLGEDFGDVRIHDDARAAASARSLHALAYTVGRDCVFASGQYAPETAAGRQLLAHELVHVLQQTGRRRDRTGTSHALQRQAEPGEAAASEADDVLKPIIAGLEEALRKLEEQEPGTEVPDGGSMPNQSDLETALREVRRVDVEGTPAEKATIAAQFAQALERETKPESTPAAAEPAVQARREGTAKGLDKLEREAETIADAVMQGQALRSGAADVTPIDHASPLVQRQGGPAEAAIGAGVAAGPPGWILLAAAGVVVLGIAVVYVATRPKDIPKSCSMVFPNAINCASLPAGYVYPSPQAALAALKVQLGNPNLRLVSPAPATGGPCPGEGMHYGVKDDGVYVASIGCCPCCSDTASGPVMTNRCRII